MKLILNDGTEHEVRSGTLPGTITMEIETYGDIQRLEESLSKSGNLDQVILGEQTAENLALLTDMHFSAGRKNNKIEVIFMLREKTPQEIAAKTQMAEVDKLLSCLSDEQALSVKNLIRRWEDDTEGYLYSLSNPDDLRRQYDDKLWKLQKDHRKQQDQHPGSDPNLWTQIVGEDSETKK